MNDDQVNLDVESDLSKDFGHLKGQSGENGSQRAREFSSKMLQDDSRFDYGVPGHLSLNDMKVLTVYSTAETRLGDSQAPSKKNSLLQLAEQARAWMSTNPHMNQAYVQDTIQVSQHIDVTACITIHELLHRTNTIKFRVFRNAKDPLNHQYVSEVFSHELLWKEITLADGLRVRQPQLPLREVFHEPKLSDMPTWIEYCRLHLALWEALLLQRLSLQGITGMRSAYSHWHPFLGHDELRAILDVSSKTASDIHSTKCAFCQSLPSSTGMLPASLEYTVHNNKVLLKHYPYLQDPSASNFANYSAQTTYQALRTAGFHNWTYDRLKDLKFLQQHYKAKKTQRNHRCRPKCADCINRRQHPTHWMPFLAAAIDAGTAWQENWWSRSGTEEPLGLWHAAITKEEGRYRAAQQQGEERRLKAEMEHAESLERLRQHELREKSLSGRAERARRGVVRAVTGVPWLVKLVGAKLTNSTTMRNAMKSG